MRGHHIPRRDAVSFEKFTMLPIVAERQLSSPRITSSKRRQQTTTNWDGCASLVIGAVATDHGLCETLSRARVLSVFFLRMRKNEQTCIRVEKGIATQGERWVQVLKEETWRLYLLLHHAGKSQRPPTQNRLEMLAEKCSIF